MKKFITKAIIFIIPILLVFTLMESVLRNIPNEYKFKKEYLDANSNEIETLILGSSHAYYGIDPTYFSSKTFNASHVSQSLDFDFEIIKKYQSYFKNLETIIVPLSYFTLFSNLALGKESWRIKYYVIYYDMDVAESVLDHSEILGGKFSINALKFTSYFKNKNNSIHCSDSGWGGAGKKSANTKILIDTGESAAKRHSPSIHHKTRQKAFKDNIEIINSLVELCENQNIELILLTTPTFETYRENLNNEQLNLTVETANSIASKSENCKYLNLIDDSRFIAEDFFDADHLSEIGAEKLSKILSAEIEKDDTLVTEMHQVIE